MNQPTRTDAPEPTEADFAAGRKLAELLAVLDRLRGPGGCPWDREQTSSSLIPYLLEETYEVIESIEAGSQSALREELGDLLLHILFQARIAEDKSAFGISDSIAAITAKLIRRHPHVFGDGSADNPVQAKENWESVKHREKQRDSRLDGVPRALPALNRARRIQEKAAYVGFDWKAIEPVWDKVREELAELEEAQKAGDKAGIEEELGDVLFSLVNLGRFLQLSAEESLHRTIRKFEDRFKLVEAELLRRGSSPEQATLEEMDSIWDRYRSSKKTP